MKHSMYTKCSFMKLLVNYRTCIPLTAHHGTGDYLITPGSVHVLVHVGLHALRLGVCLDWKQNFDCYWICFSWIKNALLLSYNLNYVLYMNIITDIWYMWFTLYMYTKGSSAKYHYYTHALSISNSAEQQQRD